MLQFVCGDNVFTKFLINNRTDPCVGTMDLYKTTKQQNKILLIRTISNYISFPPQIAYKLIEAGRSKDSLQIQGLSLDGLNNRENTTIQYIE